MKRTSVKRSILTLVLVSALLLCSCSAVKPIESSEEELRVVGYVDEFEVLYEELRFAVLTYRQMLMDAYGDDILMIPSSL